MPMLTRDNTALPIDADEAAIHDVLVEVARVVAGRVVELGQTLHQLDQTMAKLQRHFDAVEQQ